GIAYGLLRWGAGATASVRAGESAVREALAAVPEPEILVNYLGQLDRVLDADSDADALFAPADESAGPQQDPTAAPDHPLDISGGIAGGRLGLTIRFDTRLFERDTIERLAARMQDGFTAIVSAAAGGDA